MNVYSAPYQLGRSGGHLRGALCQAVLDDEVSSFDQAQLTQSSPKAIDERCGWRPTRRKADALDLSRLLRRAVIGHAATEQPSRDDELAPSHELPRARCQPSTLSGDETPVHRTKICLLMSEFRVKTSGNQCACIRSALPQSSDVSGAR